MTHPSARQTECSRPAVLQETRELLEDGIVRHDNKWDVIAALFNQNAVELCCRVDAHCVGGVFCGHGEGEIYVAFGFPHMLGFLVRGADDENFKGQPLHHLLRDLREEFGHVVQIHNDEKHL